MNITKELVDKHGFSKYRIAKLVGVSWATVQLWYKDVFKPKEVHAEELEKLLNGKEKKK